ncbi:polysaccharide biosynthesis protein [Clostridium oryzae]|uniref:UDP-N-acetyl-alpha-D-glucosamine C6 dehydratase n=1 Tax=Clostridium oryzae TaxID=1450648 RepID=A0A1V4IYR1_9CLOT|nr:nucleoside-diphosphate sugar epimerase/dehydratase [Clostridium oryzae]OPJ65039.1 UDP-N-acetyl-alpha-D-glucosamine C6 dehydratase [Clostridium oryzae]
MAKHNEFVVTDIVLIIFALLSSLLLRFDFGMDGAFKDYAQFIIMSMPPVIIFTLSFNKLFNLYNNYWNYASVEELLSIIYSVSLSNVAFIFYSYFINYKLIRINYYRFPFSVHIIFWILSVVLLGGARFMHRVYSSSERCYKKDQGKRKLLIVGAGEAGVMLIREIKRHRELNYSIVGLIDDDIKKLNKTICGIEVLGTRKDILNICKECEIEDIIVAIPSAGLSDKREIYNICKHTNCRLKTIPGIYEILDGKHSLKNVRDVSIEDLLERDEIKLNVDGINEYIHNKVVLVTGGGGSIGSELCRQLARFSPEKIIIFDVYENGAYELQLELKHNFPEVGIEVIIGSIRDYGILTSMFYRYKPEIVFHAAAHKHVPLMEENAAEAVKNNILGTYNLLKCCNSFGVKKFVQISTDKAVNPTNVMGATKRFCEIMVQAFNKGSNTEYVAVRFGNVLGSSGSVVPLFKEQIARGGPVTVTHPEVNRFFMTIPEAAQLVLEAAAMAKGGEIFVLDMGKPVKIVDLARDLIRLSGFTPDEDIKIEFIGLRKGEKLYEEPLMNELVLDNTKHEKIFVEKPMKYSMSYVNAAINEFKKVSELSSDDICELLEKEVPTYKRDNCKKEAKSQLLMV